MRDQCQAMSRNVTQNVFQALEANADVYSFELAKQFRPNISYMRTPWCNALRNFRRCSEISKFQNLLQPWWIT
jgi:hypothetical protein